MNYYYYWGWVTDCFEFVVKNEEVPRDLLLEAMLVKLEEQEKGFADVDPKITRLQKRENLGITFDYPLYRILPDPSLPKGNSFINNLFIMITTIISECE